MMINLKLNQISRYFISFVVFLSSPVFAQSRIDFDSETPIANQVIEQGEIAVTINYTPINLGEGDFSEDTNIEYTLSYQGEKRVSDRAFTLYTGSAFLQDLDNNCTAEFILKTYSGGAHCCTDIIIHHWQEDQFVQTAIEGLDGGGGKFTDLNQDGRIEFITANNAFLYQFSSYAGSFPPTMIYQFKDRNLIDVTRNYPQELEATAWQMYQIFLESKQRNSELNGILAGYVAQKILLGEYEEGWNFMLANYDRASDWGLDSYPDLFSHSFKSVFNRSRLSQTLMIDWRSIRSLRRGIFR